MSIQSLIKKTVLSITLATTCITTPFSYADNIIPTPNSDVQNLVAGFGSKTLDLMSKAPIGNEVTIPIDIAQATYLLSPNSPLVGPLTQTLLTELANVGKDADNAKYSFTWMPNSTPNAILDKEPPLKSVDINSLLQPLTYSSNIEKAQAKNVINALSGTLAPINTINFNQLVANLSGDKKTNIKAKLNEKQIQTYLSALRSYTATQAVALSNLYQLYTERQAIDVNTLPDYLKKALKAVNSQTETPVSTLQLENFMATRRIIDENWYKNLINENPATLQREQTQLMAENLAESYQTRMTLERLLATMSVLVLEFNAQVRVQLQNQIQSINNPDQNSG